MNFSKRKLPKEAADTLRACPIDSVKPYALMLAPVYVYMRMNEKFVAVKGPLDFFTPEELSRLLPLENFFLPEFVDSVVPFREAGRRVRALLSWKPRTEGGLAPAPFELSDAILRIIAPLWGGVTTVEPFFAAALAGEVCDLLPGEAMLAARDASVERYEKAVLLSGWAVFLALHLGHCELDFLSKLRESVFAEAFDGRPEAESCLEVRELKEMARASLGDTVSRGIRAEDFRSRPDRASQKIASRMERAKASLIRRDSGIPTIHGQKGFLDV
jgi:hypothetical protein